jgi:hypothetical protein
MIFRVTEKMISGTGITYTLVDGTAPAGIVVRVSYKHWRVQGTNGLLIADESVRRAMYKAVRQFDASLYLPHSSRAYGLAICPIRTGRHIRNRRDHRNNKRLR